MNEIAEEKKAIVIQKRIRGRQALNKLTRLRQLKKLKVSAAIKIQTFVVRCLSQNLHLCEIVYINIKRDQWQQEDSQSQDRIEAIVDHNYYYDNGKEVPENGSGKVKIIHNQIRFYNVYYKEV